MNRLLGPGGVLSDDQRKAFLGTNMDEQDKIVNNMGGGGASNPAYNALTASGLNPNRSGSGLLNNPGRDYYNNAGIAGS